MIVDEVISKLLENLGIREKYEIFFKKRDESEKEDVIPTEEPQINKKIIKLDDDEKSLCNEIRECGYNLEASWPLFINRFAKEILSVYDENDKEIFLQRSSDGSTLLCNWKLEKLVEHKDEPNIPCFYVKEKHIAYDKSMEENRPLNVEFNSSIFSMLHEYTMNNSPVTPSDWIRFTLRILNIITSRCKKGEWVLKKGNSSSGIGEIINWESILVPLEPKQRVLETN
jgi:hypothetical protein